MGLLSKLKDALVDRAKERTRAGAKGAVREAARTIERAMFGDNEAYPTEGEPAPPPETDGGPLGRYAAKKRGERR